eukprot:1618864-Amphidinium_carterae.1
MCRGHGCGLSLGVTLRLNFCLRPTSLNILNTSSTRGKRAKSFTQSYKVLLLGVGMHTVQSHTPLVPDFSPLASAAVGLFVQPPLWCRKDHTKTQNNFGYHEWTSAKPPSNPLSWRSS